MNGDAALAVVVVLGGAVVASTVLGVTLVTVTSGSMEPTLTTDDAFVIVDGEPAVGDIVTFRQRTDDGSQLITHRVVAERPGGYVTKGDANPTTDQAAGAPLVEPADVLGVVPELGGAPVAVPYLGWAVGVVPGVRLPLLGLVVLVLGYDLATSDRRQPDRIRHVTYGQLLALVFLLGTVGGTVGVVSVGASTDVTYQVTEAPGESPGTVAAGVAAERDVTLQATRPGFSYRFVGATGASVLTAVSDGRSTTATVRLGPLEQGPHVVELRVTNVPTTLPRGVLAVLYRLHPMAAIVASVCAVTVPVYAVSRFLLPTEVPVSWLLNTRETSPGGDR